MWSLSEFDRALRDGAAGQIPNHAQVALGHRRLSIVDLSSAGHQPMPAISQRYWIIHNGEIYNYRELRRELEDFGHRFMSQTDTEVIIVAFHQWGARCLERFNGMFAFVVYDREQQRIFAARDRYGVKPLYWWRAPDGTLALASEIKQFTVLPGWSARLNGQAAYDYLNWGLTDHRDTTMFADVRQLPPGSFVLAAIDRLGDGPPIEIWYKLHSCADVVSADAVDRWRKSFLDAVGLRLRADVPIGTALSGGLDLSAIVCAVHRLRGELTGDDDDRNSFSARSSDPLFDEGPYIAAVVRATDVKEHAVWPDVDELFDNLSTLAWHLDEPYGSTSVFAEWCVFRKVATTLVRVTLDGHGADEFWPDTRPSAAYSSPTCCGTAACRVCCTRALLSCSRVATERGISPCQPSTISFPPVCAQPFVGLEAGHRRALTGSISAGSPRSRMIPTRGQAVGAEEFAAFRFLKWERQVYPCNCDGQIAIRWRTRSRAVRLSLTSIWWSRRWDCRTRLSSIAA